jgi:streptogramin lyase
MEEAKRFGTDLFAELFQGDVRDVYTGARRVADERDTGLRVTLYLTGVPELMDIPWEYLYERPTFLAQSIYTPVVRSLDLKSVRPPRRVEYPLRVIGIISRPLGFDALDVAEERSKLEQALGLLVDRGMIDLHWLPSATLLDLERALGRLGDVHIIHYIGHGAYDERTEGGILVLERGDRAPHEVTGEELCAVVSDERSLRLVVLNSCEGARTSHVDPFSGVASSLVECGIPAVVGMQFEITDGAAIAFSDRMYTALADGYPADAALAQARKAIFAAGFETEFGTPVLFLRGGDATLFDLDLSSAQSDAIQPDGIGGAELSLSLSCRPGGAGDATIVSWRLVVVNTGSCELTDVTARAPDGRVLANPLELTPGRSDSIGWIEAGSGGSHYIVTVTATDPAGSRISEQVAAEASALLPTGADARPMDESKGEPDRIGALEPRSSEEMRVGENPLAKESSTGSDFELFEIDVGPNMGHFAFLDGSVWVHRGNSVLKVDGATGAILGEFEIGTGAAPDGLGACDGRLWVLRTTTFTVYLQSVEVSGKLGKRIRVSRIPLLDWKGDVISDDNVLWVSNSNLNSVYRIDCRKRSVKAIVTGGAPVDLAVGRDDIWVADRGSGTSGTLRRIVKGAEPTLAERIEVGPMVPPPSVFSKAGDKLVIARGEGVLLVDVKPRESTRSAYRVTESQEISVGAQPVALCTSNGTVWVTTRDGRVVLIDPEAGQVTDSKINVGEGAWAMAAMDDAVWVLAAGGALARITGIESAIAAPSGTAR